MPYISMHMQWLVKKIIPSKSSPGKEPMKHLYEPRGLILLLGKEEGYT